MLEAMAAGLPIIATRIPAHEDLLTNGETGWLCASPAELGEALVALDEGDRNVEVGKRARERMRETTGTWDDCASRYADIYDGLMAR
jgi:glycosyltransferase involved in cell wall biosynthesis